MQRYFEMQMLAVQHYLSDMQKSVVKLKMQKIKAIENEISSRLVKIANVSLLDQSGKFSNRAGKRRSMLNCLSIINMKEVTGNSMG